MYKGALHAHSTYSDGEFTLAELKKIFAAAGCAFVGITDHAEAFDGAALESYRRECEALSDEHFCFLPGLEFECERRMHILGYGVTSRASTQNPQEVIHHIQGEGGIAVIAHPKDDAFAWIEDFSTLPDGIEAWNTKYDGRFAPRPETFRFLNRLQSRQPNLRAFYGQDLHWKKQYRGLFNLLTGTSVRGEEILRAFRRGEYQGVKDELTLPSDGNLPGPLLERFGVVHQRSDRFRTLVKNVKKLADQLGVAVPPALKKHLRRIF